MTDMNIIMRPIGTIESGIDGSDQYLLLERKDDDLTPEQARDWLMPQVYREGGGAGSYFVHTVLAVQAAHSTNRVICTVQHRYDV